MSYWDILFTDVHLACMTEGDSPYGIIENAALAVKDGQIVWLGKLVDVPVGSEPMITRHLGGAWITPGLIDCHTHMIFGGNRAEDFEMRLQGTSYSDITKSGGGIHSTVNATRKASEDDLFVQAYQFVEEAQQQGITTLEIKSGYGLNLEDEIKMLRVAKRIGESLDIDITTTCMAAHTIPAEYSDKPDAYVDIIINDIIPTVAKENLATAVDAFMETIAFTAKQTSRIFDAAKENGLAIKLHADQLSNTKGASLAAKYNALSADHLEHTTLPGVKAMAEAGTVAVLLPGAFYNLHETKIPPIAALRKQGVPMALASDFNPGSSPCNSLQLMLHMGCTLYGLTPEEALAGVTRNAAKALGFNDRGTLEAGKKAHLAMWNIDHPRELSYWFGRNLLAERYY